MNSVNYIYIVSRVSVTIPEMSTALHTDSIEGLLPLAIAVRLRINKIDVHCCCAVFV